MGFKDRVAVYTVKIKPRSTNQEVQTSPKGVKEKNITFVRSSINQAKQGAIAHDQADEAEEEGEDMGVGNAESGGKQPTSRVETSTFCTQGHRGAGANPSCLQARAELQPGQDASSS